MSKVTSKRQVTIPKAVAERYGIGSGDEVEFEPAGEVIRLIPPAGQRPWPSIEERLRLFDRATERQRQRESRRSPRAAEGVEQVPSTGRDWTREELYERGPRVPRGLLLGDTMRRHGRCPLPFVP